MSVFSVLLCNYNYAHFLREAIESVLSQTFRDFELVIVDDGSTDNSQEIINSFSDERIVSILQQNAGQAAAFNTGFDACKGNYVAFLDSDDFWYADKLSITFEAFKNSEVVAVQHNLDVIDERSCLLGWFHPSIKAGVRDVLKAYFKENHTGFFSATSGIACRKDVLEKIFPIDTNWTICADIAFSRPLPIFGKIANLEKNLGCYRIHSLNNWMNSASQKKYIDNEKKYVTYVNYWLEKFSYNEILVFEKSRPYKIARILNSPFGFVYTFLRGLKHKINGFLRAKFN